MRIIPFAVLSALIALTACEGADFTRGSFDKLPSEIEVHAVAVYEPHFSGISQEEITDWQGFVKALR